YFGVLLVRGLAGDAGRTQGPILTGGRIALDATVGALDIAGPRRYVRSLEAALLPVLGDRLVSVCSRFAAPAPPACTRKIGAMARTLGRDVWWHQEGVE